ncbi:MAG: 4Fe-4S dicluster domain-containing protein [Desulfobacteraceae bacterium]|nr:MAG: 4Fe-4S dicluster domain-containing protein [Desulfobacteraceae bacterium]
MPKAEEVRRKEALSGDAPPPPMTAEEAMAEACRCLSLNQCEGCEACRLICPDQAITKDADTQRPVIDLRYCKGCGLCAHVCPKDAIVMVTEQG